MKSSKSPEQIRVELINLLAEIQKKRPSFSVRQLAQAFQVDYSSFTRILSGKRKLTDKLANQLEARLITITDEIGLPQDIQARELTQQEHRTLARWVSPAIQELCHTVNFNSTAEEISKRLGLDIKDVESVLSTLIDIGFLIRTQDGKLLDSVPAWYSDTFKDDPESKNANLEDLKDLNRRAESSYMNEQDDLKSFSSIIIATDPVLIPKAQELIARFRKDLLALFRSKEPKVVFVSKIELFPLSK